jgi:biopolymer transport protein ExbB
VAALLLAMSVSAWVLIFWKGWVLLRARRDIDRAVPAFWSAGSLDAGRTRLAALDREQVLLPMLDAGTALDPDPARWPPRPRWARSSRGACATPCSAAWPTCSFGQVLLASIGSTAPFIGLFGTVWGIYHALISISAAGSLTIDKVSGPVGEALVMTAAGLAVAIPAVLAYNLFGQWVAACEAALEGFAHDLREMALDGAAARAGG